MQQAFHQQNVLSLDIRFMAEENLQKVARPFASLLAIPGFDELAGHGNLKGPDQVRHEHESVLEQRHGMQGLAAIIIGNLPCYFAYPLLDLFGWDYDAQLFGL